MHNVLIFINIHQKIKCTGVIDTIHSKDNNNPMGTKRKASELDSSSLGEILILKGILTLSIPSLSFDTLQIFSNTILVFDLTYALPLSSTIPLTISTHPS